MPALAPILVSFARPEESRTFRRRVMGQPAEKISGTALLSGQIGATVVEIVHTGIGPEAAERTARAILTDRKPRHWIAAGFAGALDPAIGVGEVFREDFGRGLPQANQTERAPRRMVSRPCPVESVEEKAALFREAGAAVVDMETATLASLCAEAGVRMTAVRAVSDTAREPLPVPFAIWFDARRQQPRPWRLLAWLARHPGSLPPFVRFVRRLGQVAEALASAVEEEIRVSGTAAGHEGPPRA